MSKVKNYKIEFLRDVGVERAPKDPKKGGFEVETIKKGTVMDVSLASYNFWNAKGVVKLLQSDPTPFRPFGFNPDQVDPPAWTKKALREELLKASKAIEDGDGLTLAAVLTSIEWKQVEELIEDLDDDSEMLITAAAQDYATVGQTSVSAVELKEALDRAADICLPKSKRTLTKT